MIERLQDLPLAGTCHGRRWQATYVHPYRYATRSIAVESAPGHWDPVHNLRFVSWETEGQMRVAIERHVAQHLCLSHPSRMRTSADSGHGARHVTRPPSLEPWAWVAQWLADLRSAAAGGDSQAAAFLPSLAPIALVAELLERASCRSMDR